MKIDVECPECRATFQVAQDHAGKRGRCPRCKEVVQVPAARLVEPKAVLVEPKAVMVEVDLEDSDPYDLVGAPTAAAAARKTAARALAKGSKSAEAGPTRPTRTPAQILAAFREEIEPVKPTAMYRLWAVIIAFVMVLLPVLYLGLVVLVGYGVYLHATTNHTLLQAAGGNRGSSKGAFLAYFGPLIAGSIVVAFMLKPLFAKSAKQTKVRQIDPSAEPLIAAFIDGVCTSVGAPTPARIEVDCQVNASAHLASWVLSPSKELVLTIGLPLVAGLSLREFTGVLAHEFGHFSQGAGMRLSYLIRSINLWFARVVYERDSWDETLASWNQNSQGGIVVVVLLVRASVWLTRRILWVLMYVGHMFSGFFSRQMEFDADRYQARMVGGETIARTMERINELGLAWNAAHSELGMSWRDRRLPDDLPKLVLVEASKIPDPVRVALRESIEKSKTGLFDTHPADAERIARARIEAPEGIFDLDGPATDLFRDFDSLALATTFDYYRSMLGDEVTPDQLFPVTEALLNQQVHREGSEAFERFFLGGIGPIQPLALPESYPKAPADPKAVKRDLIAARESMLGALESNRQTLESWSKAHDQAAKTNAAVLLIKLGKKAIRYRDFNLPSGKISVVEASQEESLREIEAIEPDLEPFARLAADRLALALSLLEIEPVAAKLPDGLARREEARALYQCARTLGVRIVPDMGKFLRAMQAAGVVFTNYQADQSEAMLNALRRVAQTVHESLTELRWKIGDAIPYPFEHAQGQMTLARYILPTVPNVSEIGEVLQAGSEAQDRIFSLHHRVLGRLAATAETVEKALSLEPLKIPEPAAS